jgi:2-dehydropantoate 2-reductase
MRYVVYGAGAIGGTIGALLHQAGVATTLVARGRHLEAMRRDGLRFVRPGGEVALDVVCAGSAAEAAVGTDDTVIVATKTQDALAALEDLAVVQPRAAVVCATNGVEAERMALRRFEHVYGMGVLLPATHLEPGVVRAEGAPSPGILDVGRYPSGVDERCRRISADLTRAGFLSTPLADVMRQKYAKLLMNTINAVDAAVGRVGPLIRAARAEASAVFEAAGIAYQSDDDPRREQVRIEPIEGYQRIGSSSAQSLARGAGTIETDYLAGEIVLLGRLHGVPTPVNALLQQVNRAMAANGEAPGSRDPQALMAELGIDEAAET